MSTPVETSVVVLPLQATKLTKGTKSKKTTSPATKKKTLTLTQSQGSRKSASMKLSPYFSKYVGNYFTVVDLADDKIGFSFTENQLTGYRQTTNKKAHSSPVLSGRTTINADKAYILTKLGMTTEGAVLNLVKAEVEGNIYLIDSIAEVTDASEVTEVETTEAETTKSI